MKIGLTADKKLKLHRLIVNFYSQVKWPMVFVALLALGMLNVLFVQGLDRMALSESALALASAGLVVGALTMPACCALAAFGRRSPVLFVVPVTSLLMGVGLTTWGLAAHILGVS